MLGLSSPLSRRRMVTCLFGLLSAACFLVMRSSFDFYSTLLYSLHSNHMSTFYTRHSLSSMSSSSPNRVTKNVAAIIEDRRLERLVPLLLYFSNVLGPDWPITIFTSQDLIPNSAPFKRAIDESRIIVKFLPPGVQAFTRREYNRILTTSWIWEQLAPAEKVFIFQGDSIICTNSPHTINDFIDYDFIAAPYDRWVGEDTNDGLSLRNRAMTLDIVKAVDFGDLKKSTKAQFDVVDSEEQWLYQKLKDLSTLSSGGLRPRLPTKEMAMKFSVGRVWHKRSFGYQHLAGLKALQKEEMDSWCPEYRLAIESLPF